MSDERRKKPESAKDRPDQRPEEKSRSEIAAGNEIGWDEDLASEPGAEPQPNGETFAPTSAAPGTARGALKDTSVAAANASDSDLAAGAQAGSPSVSASATATRGRGGHTASGADFGTGLEITPSGDASGPIIPTASAAAERRGSEAPLDAAASASGTAAGTTHGHASAGSTGGTAAGGSASSQPTTNPLIVTGEYGGKVREDDVSATQGHLAASGGAGGVHWQVDQGQGAYGHFTVGTDGSWRFVLDGNSPGVQALAEGERVSETFTVIATDTAGTVVTTPIKIMLEGTNDAPRLVSGSVTTGLVTEDASTSHVEGRIAVTDPDTGAQLHWNVDHLDGAYGTLVFDDISGRWSYTLDNTRPATQGLRDGQQVQEIFTATVTDEHGVGTPVRVAVTVTGSGDAPVIGGIASGAVTEDTLARASGALSIQDADAGEAQFQAGQIAGHYGTLNLDSSGTWTYDLDNANPDVQALAAGVPLQETIPVRSADGSVVQITLQITGTNDAAQISGVGHGTVREDQLQGAELRAAGHLDVYDADSGEAGFANQAQHGSLGGTLVLQPGGDWSYTLDNSLPAVQALGDGEKLTETFRVTSLDGTEHVITVDILGTNDAPDLRVTPTDAIHGLLEQTDVDTGDTPTFGVTGSGSGQFGSLSVDPQTGAYVYMPSDSVQGMTLDPASGTYRGQDTFEVQVDDGHGGVTSKFLTFSPTGSVTAPAGPGLPPQVTVRVDAPPVQGTTPPSAGPAGQAGPAGAVGGPMGAASAQPTNAVTLALDASSDTGASDQDGITHDTTPTLTGTVGIPYSRVEIFDGATRIGEAYADDQGRYSLAVGQDLAEGGHTLSAQATAPNGLPPTSSPDLAVTIDTTLVATDDSFTATEDQAGTTHGNLLANDGTRATLTTAGGVAGQYGTFHLESDGSFTYTLNTNAQHLAAGETQPDRVDYTIIDAAGNSASATLTVSVTGTNDAPVLQAITARSVDEGARISGTLDASDPDSGAQLTFRVGAPVLGLTLNPDGSYTFDASHPIYQSLAAGETRDITVPIVVTDQFGASDQRNLEIHLTGTNDAPIIGGVDAAIASTADAHGGHLHLGGELTIFDVDTGESHFQSMLLQGSYGTLGIGADGRWSYSADATQTALASLGPGASAAEHFVVRTADGTEHAIDLNIYGSTSTAIIGGVSRGLVVEDQANSLTRKLDVIDPNPTEAHFNAVDHDTDHGHFTLAEDGTWTYTLDVTNPAVQGLGNGATLTERVMVSSADGTPQIVTVIIAGSNDAPVIGGASSGAVTEDNALTATGALSVSDADTGEAHFQAGDVAGVFGTLHIDADGAWTYTLDNSNPEVQELGDGDFTTDTLTVRTADGTAHNIVVRINGTNDLPQIAGTTAGGNLQIGSGSGQLAGTLVASDTDISATLTWSADHTDGSYGSLVLDTATGAWSYTIDASRDATRALALGEHASETFVVSVTDDQGASDRTTIRVNLVGTNDAPVLQAITARSVDEGARISGTLDASDPDSGAQLTFRVGAPVLGLTLNPDGSYTFDASHPIYQSLAAGETRDITVPIVVTDQFGASDQRNLEIHLTGTNDAPIIGGVDAAIASTADAHGGHLHLGGELTIFDVDTGESHFQSMLLQGSYGTLGIGADGRWSYSADATQTALASLGPGASAAEHFVVRTADGTEHAIDLNIYGSTSTAIIGGVSRGLVVEDQANSLTRKLDVIDPNPTEAHFNAVDHDTDHGHFTLAEDGTWTYTLDVTNPAVQGLGNGATLTERVMVSSADGTPQIVTVIIAGSNDAPVIGGASSGAVTEDNALTATGALSVSDADTGEAHFQAGDVAGVFGTLHIDADGAWTYTLDNSNPEVQELGDGDFTTDTLTVRTADGTAHDIVVHINGTDDRPTVTGDDGAVLWEDREAHPGQLAYSGRLNVSDVDFGESSFQVQTDVEGSGGYGHFTIDSDGRWSYIADNSNPAIQQLAAGERVTDQLVVTTLDGTRQTLTVTIEGANDAAVIGGARSGDVTEESATTARGTLTVADVDRDEAHFQAGDVAGSYGTLHIDAAGHWNYALDNGLASVQALGEGDRVTEQLTVRTVDGTEQILTLTIHGTNDAAHIAGVDHAAIDEDDFSQSLSNDLVAHGQLSVSDIDTDEAGFAAQNIHGPHQSVLVLTPSGRWTFMAHGDDPAIQALGDGDQLSIPFKVTSLDGTEHTVTVDIVGTNDRAVIGGTDSATVTEDTATTARGTLTVSDADTGEDAFRADDYAGTFGTLHLDANGSWVYVLDNDRPAVQSLGTGESETDRITVVTTDGTTHEVVVTVQGTNDRPVATAIPNFRIGEGDHLQARVPAGTFTDAEGGTLTYAATLADGSPLPTWLHFDPDTQTFSGDPGHANVGALNLRIEATDTDGASVHQDFQLEVVDDVAPVRPTLSTLAANLPDATPTLQGVAEPGAIVTITDHGQVLGTATATAAGTFTFTPATDLADGDHTFRAFATDAAGNPSPASAPAQTSIDTQTHSELSIDRIDNALEVRIETRGGHPVHGANHPGGGGSKWAAEAYEITSGDVTVQGTATGVPDGTQVHLHLVDRNDASIVYDLATTASGGGWTATLDHTQMDRVSGDHDWQVKVTTTDKFGHTLHTGTEIIDQGQLTQDLTEDGQAGAIDLREGVDGLSVGPLLYSTDGVHFSSRVPDGFALNADGHTLHVDPSAAGFDHLAAGDKAEVFIKYSLGETVAGTAESVEQVAVVTLTGTNDAPVVTATAGTPADLGATLEDMARSFTQEDLLRLVGATDAEGDNLLVTGVDIDSAYGEFHALANGRWLFVPEKDVSGDAIPVRITVSDGSLSTEAHATFDITAQNDAPVFAPGAVPPAPPLPGSGSVAPPPVSDPGNYAQVEEGSTVSGHLRASDADPGDTLRFETPFTVPGLTLHADGSYTFDASNPAYARLQESETTRLAVPVMVTDSQGATAQGSLTITIVGTNDVPLIGGIDHAMGSVAGSKDGRVHVDGQLMIMDPDHGESFFQAGVIKGAYGFLNIDPDGHWSYSADASQPALARLADSEQVPESFRVETADGTSHDIVLQIKGGNTPAIFGGVTVGVVKEDTDISTSGRMSVSDPNVGESAFVPIDRDTPHGHFTLDAQGAWTFTLANDHPDVQSLAEGQNLVERITVGSVDGTPQVVTINIAGTGDVAQIAGVDTLSVDEDDTRMGHLSLAGKLAISDVDSGEDRFVDDLQIDGSSGLGTFGITAGGDWFYTADANNPAIQALGPGQTLVETAEVRSLDGTTHTLTVTIHGSMDAPSLSVSTGATQAAAGHAEAHATVGSVQSTGFVMHALGFGEAFEDANGNLQLPALETARLGTNAHGDTFGVDAARPAVAQGTAPEQDSIDSQIIQGQDKGDQPGETLVIELQGVSKSAVLLLNGLSGHGDKLTWTAYAADGTPVDHGVLESTGQGAAVQALPIETQNPFAFVALHAEAPAPEATRSGGTTQFSTNVGVERVEAELLRFETPLTLSAAVGDSADTNQQLAWRITGLEQAELSSGTRNADGSWTVTEAEAQGLQVLHSGVLHLQVAAVATDPVTGDSAASAPATVTVDPSGASYTVITGSPLALTDEDSTSTLTGDFDIDTNKGTPPAFVAEGQDGHYGHFQIDAQGTWTYALDTDRAQELAGGPYEERFTVRTEDGANRDLTVIIHGHNDPLQLVDVAGTSTRGPAAVVGGHLQAVDPDNAHDTFNFVADYNDLERGSDQSVVEGKYGTLTVDELTGTWNYVVDPSKAAQIPAGSPAEESFPVHVMNMDSFGDLADLTLKVAVNHAGQAMVEVPGQADALQALDDKAVAVDDRASATEDQAGPVTGNVLANDEAGATVTSTADQQGAYGTLALQADGGYTYTLDARAQVLAAGESHQERFTYEITDAAGNTATAHLVVTVTGTNDAPVVSAPVTLTDADAAMPLHISEAQLLAHASDPDGDALSVENLASVSTGPSTQVARALLSMGHSAQNLEVSHGTVTADPAGGYLYTPEAGYEGPVRLTYDVVDPQGARVATHADFDTVAVSHAAVITDTSHETVTEDVSGLATGRLGISDLDGSNEELFTPLFNAQSDQGYGHFSISVGGTWVYRLDDSHQAVDALAAGETLTDTITVNSADGTAHQLHVTIAGTDDAPNVQAGDLGTVEQGLTRTFTSAELLQTVHATDVDTAADQLAISSVWVDPQYGVITHTGDSWALTPVSGVTHDDIPVKVTVTDGTTSVTADATLDITPPARMAIEGVSYYYADDTAHTHPIADLGDLDAARLGHGLVAVGQVTGPELSQLQLTSAVMVSEGSGMAGGGQVQMEANGHFEVTFDENDLLNLQGKELYIVFNVGGQMRGQTTGAHLTSPSFVVDTVPIAASDTDLGEVEAGAPLPLDINTLLAGATDADGDALTLVPGSLSSPHGTITGDAQSGFVFHPEPGFSGDDVHIAYQLTDGRHTVDTFATVDVLHPDHAPVASSLVNLGVAVEETGTKLSMDKLLSGASDADGDALSVVAGSFSSRYGQVTDDGHGGFVFTPAHGVQGVRAISYQLTDGKGHVVDATAIIEVAPGVRITGITPDTGTQADFTTSDPTILISGSSAPGATVKVQTMDSSHLELGTTTADADGHWTLDATGHALPDGATPLVAIASLPSGYFALAQQEVTIAPDGRSASVGELLPIDDGSVVGVEHPDMMFTAYTGEPAPDDQAGAVGDLSPPTDDTSQEVHDTSYDDTMVATGSGTDSDHAVDDYMQFADTTQQGDSPAAADGAVPSPLADYLVAAGVEPTDLQQVESVTSPDPTLVDVPDTQPAPTSPEDMIDEGLDTGGDVADPSLLDDPQHHGV